MVGKNWWVLLGAVLVGLCLTVRMIGAVEVSREAAMFWDDPAFEQGYTVASLPQPVSYTLYLDLEIRAGGLVLASQSVESDCAAAMQSGAGQCGALDSWTWETDDWAGYHFSMVTEYVRPHWIPSGCDGMCPPDVYGVYIPPDCELAADSCEVTFVEDDEALIPDLNAECRSALAICRTGQDESGFWYVGTIPESGAVYYLPILMKGQ